MSTPSILIIGRPNVGKSTLFNRLNKQRKAIVHDFPGVTRDLIFSYCNYEDKNFILIDSGGIGMEESVMITQDAFQKQIEENVKGAIETSDLIIFLTDSQEGLSPYDQVIAKSLRPYKEKVVLAVNKTENTAQELGAAEFFSLGIEDVFFISSTQGIGIKNMMTHIFKKLNMTNKTSGFVDKENIKKIAIIGRPNVGKSSVFNALAGKDMMIVSDVAGTTRDSVDHLITFYQREYLFIDTAGLKKKAQHTKDAIDFYSYIRTIKAISDSDICLFIIDAADGITNMDKHIANLIIEEGRAIIILVNKWDKVEKDSNTLVSYTKYMHQQLHFADHAPLIFTSAKTRQRLVNVFDTIDNVYNNYTKRISTSMMNKFLENLKSRPGFNSVYKSQGKILYISQVKTAPPRFAVFVNKKDYFKENFTKFITKHIRETFDFSGCTIKINYKEKLKN